jgi:hypothetical protein
MGAQVSVYVHQDCEIEFDGNFLRLTAGVDVTFDDPATMRRLALVLFLEADQRDLNTEQSKRDLLEAVEEVAKIRREKGEIADDGMCWDCKAGDHSRHKDYYESICVGCGCAERPASKRAQL